MEKYLKKLELSENLTLQESIDAFEILMNGKAFPFIKISKASILSCNVKFSLNSSFFKYFSIYLIKFFKIFKPSLVFILSG